MVGAAVAIDRIAARAFPGHSALSLDPDLRVFVGDQVRPYGIALREDLLRAGAGRSYGEMAEELIRETVTESEPVDLLVLAYAMPDVQPGRSTALYLSAVCPGTPLAFTVCDQGIAAPYTAVRLALEYLRSGDRTRALIVIAENAALHYELVEEFGVRPRLPAENVAVAVLCGGVGTSGVCEIREHAGVEPADVRVLLRAQLAGLDAPGSDGARRATRRRVLVRGGGLSKADVAAESDATDFDLIATAPGDQPCTGAWRELATGYREWSEQGCLVVLADYDAQLRTLCLCSIKAGDT